MDKPSAGAARPWSETRVLVTGASGFLGLHLCRRLLAEGAEVHAVSRSPRQGADRDGLHWWQCDVVDGAAVHDVVSRIKPDAVVHLGGLVTAAPDMRLVALTFHSLLTSTINVLTAATDIGRCRVILSGSLEEPISSAADSLVPTSPYSAAKLAAGAYARMFVKLYGTPVVTLRPYMTYGPGQHPSKVIPYTIQSLLRGEAPQLSSGERALDWVYVDDVIDAYLLAVTRPGVEGRTLDLGWGAAVRIRDVVDRLVALVDRSIAPRYGAQPDRPDASARVADLEATAAALGWRPRIALEQGLARTIDWYRRALVEPERSDA